MGTNSAQRMTDTIQEHVPEPVVAVGAVQPAGTWGSFGISQLSPLAGALKNRKANRNAGGMAKNSIWSGTKLAAVAVTAERIYTFKAKPRGRSWKIGDPLATWERRDVQISLEPGKLATKVIIDVTSTGDHYEFEVTTMMTRGFGDAFLAELAKT